MPKKEMVIMENSNPHRLIEEYKDWVKKNPNVTDVEIHYSHAIAYKVDTREAEFCPDESYSLMILFNK